MASPEKTRLRYAASKDPEKLSLYINDLGVRVMLYSIAHDGKKWIAWFVPDDQRNLDPGNVDLDDL